MKVLVIDDHPIVRAGFRRLLADEPQFEIAEAASGHEAIGACRDLRPDIVILDLNLPGISGLELLGRLKIQDPNIKVLVISMYDNPAYVARILKAGARGYASKNAPAEQILKAIKDVVSGRGYIDHEIAQELIFADRRSPSYSLRDLSRRELEILRLLADGRNLTEIAGAIGLSYKTVANQCSLLKAKLAAPRIADLIHFAISAGLGRADPGIAEAVDSIAGGNRPSIRSPLRARSRN